MQSHMCEDEDADSLAIRLYLERGQGGLFLADD